MDPNTERRIVVYMAIALDKRWNVVASGAFPSYRQAWQWAERLTPDVSREHGPVQWRIAYDAMTA